MTARRAANASAGFISGLTAAFTFVGHVLDRLQDVQLQVGALQLLGAGLGVEAVAEQVARPAC